MSDNRCHFCPNEASRTLSIHVWGEGAFPSCPSCYLKVLGFTCVDEVVKAYKKWPNPLTRDTQ